MSYDMHLSSQFRRLVQDYEWNDETVRSLNIHSKKVFFKRIAKILSDNKSESVDCVNLLGNLGNNWKKLNLPDLNENDISLFISSATKDLINSLPLCENALASTSANQVNEDPITYLSIAYRNKNAQLFKELVKNFHINEQDVTTNLLPSFTGEEDLNFIKEFCAILTIPDLVNLNYTAYEKNDDTGKKLLFEHLTRILSDKELMDRYGKPEDFLQIVIEFFDPNNPDLTQLRILHQYGVDFNKTIITPNYKETPLEYAIAELEDDSRYKILIDELIRLGADPLLKSEETDLSAYAKLLFPDIESYMEPDMENSITSVEWDLLEEIKHTLDTYPSMKEYASVCRTSDLDLIELERTKLLMDEELSDFVSRVSPLMLAVYTGCDYAVLSNLKNHSTQSGIPVNELTCAVAGGQIDLVNEIIQNSPEQVNLQLSCGTTPLMVAADKGDYEIVNLLLKAGADAKILNHLGYDAYYLSRDCVCDNHKITSKLIAVHLTDNQQQRLYVPIIKIKTLAHILHLGGKESVSIESNNPQSIIEYEGASPQFIIRKLQKSTTAFYNRVKDASDKAVLEQLMDVLKSLIEISEENELVERINTKIPTFISTGFEDHSVISFFWNDCYIHCDTAAGHKPLFAFTFNREKDLTQVVKKLDQIKVEDSIDYANAIGEFYSLLEFEKTARDVEIEQATNVSFQTVGNCTYSSIEAAIKSFFFLSRNPNLLFDENNRSNMERQSASSSLEEISAAQDKASLKLFDEWLLFTKAYHTEEYLSTSGRTGKLTEKTGTQHVVKVIPSLIDEAYKQLIHDFESTTVDEMIKQDIQTIKGDLKQFLEDKVIQETPK